MEVNGHYQALLPNGHRPLRSLSGAHLFIWNDKYFGQPLPQIVIDREDPPAACIFSQLRRLTKGTHQSKQKAEQLLDQLSVALVELALFDAIDEPLDLGCVNSGKVVVVFHRGRSRRSYVKPRRTPRSRAQIFSFFTRAHCKKPPACAL